MASSRSLCLGWALAGLARHGTGILSHHHGGVCTNILWREAYDAPKTTRWDEMSGFALSLSRVCRQTSCAAAFHFFFIVSSPLPTQHIDPHTHVPDFSLTQTTTTPDHITLHMHDNTYHAYLSVFLPLHFMTFHFILLFFLASLTFFILFLNLSRSLILPRCLAYGAGVQRVCVCVSPPRPACMRTTGARAGYHTLTLTPSSSLSHIFEAYQPPFFVLVLLGPHHGGSTLMPAALISQHMHARPTSEREIGFAAQQDWICASGTGPYDDKYHLSIRWVCMYVWMCSLALVWLMRSPSPPVRRVPRAWFVLVLVRVSPVGVISDERGDDACIE